MVNTKSRLIIFFVAKDGKALNSQTRSWLWLRSWMSYCKIHTQIEESRETRSFRYDPCQIPYDYTVEVTNRFKELDLIDRVPKELWKKVHNIVQECSPKLYPRKRNAKRQNDSLRRSYKELRKEEMWKSKEKRKDIPIWMQSSREKQGEIRKPF